MSRALLLIGGAAAIVAADKSGLDGSQLTLVDCKPGAWNQKWALSTDAAGKYTLALDEVIGVCLDCDGCYDGHVPHMWDCDPTNSNQLYNVVPGKSGAVSLQSTRPDVKPSPSCLASFANESSAPLEMRTCDTSTSTQSFKYDKTTGLMSSVAHGGKCVAIAGVPCAVQRMVAKGNRSLLSAWCDEMSLPGIRAAALVAAMTTHEKVANLGTGPFQMGVARLGIKGPQFEEALHGVAADCGAPAPNQLDGSNSSGCATSFSHGMALGATFNRTLWTLVADTIGTEARAMSNQGKTGHSFWAPDINLARDPRWGRGQEVHRVFALSRAPSDPTPPPPLTLTHTPHPHPHPHPPPLSLSLSYRSLARIPFLMPSTSFAMPPHSSLARTTMRRRGSPLRSLAVRSSVGRMATALLVATSRQ